MNTKKQHFKKYKITWAGGRSDIIDKEKILAASLLRAIDFIEHTDGCCGVTLKNGIQIEPVDNT